MCWRRGEFSSTAGHTTQYPERIFIDTSIDIPRHVVGYGLNTQYMHFLVSLCGTISKYNIHHEIGRKKGCASVFLVEKKRKKKQVSLDRGSTSTSEVLTIRIYPSPPRWDH